MTAPLPSRTWAIPVWIFLVMVGTSSVAEQDAGSQESALTADQRERLKAADETFEQVFELLVDKKWDEAINAAKKVVQIRREILGTQNLEYVDSINLLAYIFNDLRDFAKAEPLYREVRETRKKILGAKHPDYANSLHNLALHYLKTRKYEQAEPLLEEARDVRRQIFGADHPEYADILMTLAGCHFEQRKYSEALPLAKEARRLLKESYGEDHVEYGASLSLLGCIYQEMSDSDQAEAMLSLACRVYKSAKGEEHLSYGKSLKELGNLYSSLGRYRDAERVTLEAVAIYEDYLGTRHPEYANLLNSLALTYARMAQFDKSEQLYLEVRDIYEELLSSDDPSYGIVLNNLADFYNTAGEYAKAERLYHEAREIWKKSLGEDHPYYALVLSNLSVVYCGMGDFAQSEHYGRQSLQAKRNSLGDKHQDVAISLCNFGALYRILGKYAEAEPMYTEAIDILQESGGDKQPLYAYTLTGLSELCLRTGEHDRVQEICREASAIWKELVGENHPNYAISVNNLALAYIAQSDFDAAKPLLQEAIDIFKSAYGGHHHPNYYTCLVNLALVHLAAGELPEAESLAREAFEHERDFAVGILPWLSEARAMAFRNKVRGCGALLSVLRLNHKERAEDAYVAAWLSRGLVTQLLAQRRRLSHSSPEAQELYAQLQNTGQELAQLTLSVTKPEQEQSRRERLATLNEKKENLEMELGRISREHQRNQKLVTSRPQDLAAILSSGTAVVDFFRVGVWPNIPTSDFKFASEPHYDAFIVQHGPSGSPLRVQWVKLGPTAPIDDAIAHWRKDIVTPSPASVDRTGPERILRELVWNKIDAHLDGCSKVIVIPDGELCFVPWAALPGRKQGSWLVEDYAIMTAPSGQQLCESLLAPRATANSLLLAGGVQYDAPSTSVSDDHGASESPNTWTRSPALKTPNRWQPLEGTLGEIREIEKLWTGQVRPRTLQGPEASEASLRQLMPGAGVVHLATHGFFADPEFRSMFGHDDGAEHLFGGQQMMTAKLARVTARNPLILTGVVLAGANVPAETENPNGRIPDDGILTAEEIINLDLRGTELVVLSACETGLGSVAGGEGVLGLTRAFHLAGARNVMASLWKVEDSATKALMVEFYRNKWHRGMQEQEALRQAQLTMIRKYDPTEGKLRGLQLTGAEEPTPAGKTSPLPPFYWAAFVLSGAER